MTETDAPRPAKLARVSLERPSSSGESKHMQATTAGKMKVKRTPKRGMLPNPIVERLAELKE